MELKIHDEYNKLRLSFASEEELELNADSLTREEWDLISKKMTELSDDFINKFDDQLNWRYFHFNQYNKPPKKFLIKYSDKLYFALILLKWVEEYNHKHHNSTFAMDLTAYGVEVLDKLYCDSNYENFVKTAHIFETQKEKMLRVKWK